MEHLFDPLRAIGEMHRVLMLDGVAGLCSPDWGGFILAPPSPQLSSAVDAYTRLQAKNGGDVLVGRKLGLLLRQAGFSDISMSARYECYSSLPFVPWHLQMNSRRFLHSPFGRGALA